MLADGSKMGRAGVFEVRPMAMVGRSVTGLMEGPLLDAAKAAGIRVEIVSLD